MERVFGVTVGPLSLCVDNQRTIFRASISAQERPYEIRSDDEHFIRDIVEFFGKIKLYNLSYRHITDILTRRYSEKKDTSTSTLQTIVTFLARSVENPGISYSDSYPDTRF